MVDKIKAGTTCRVGKGKTVWEIVAIDGDTLQLSALGRGGFVNRSAKATEVTDVQPGTMVFSLATVLHERARARTAAHALWDRLRFSDPGSIYRLTDEAEEAARSYASVCEGHSRELVELNIQEG
jgi:hypothetical protein